MSVPGVKRFFIIFRVVYNFFFAPRGAERKEVFEEQTESHDTSKRLVFMLVENTADRSSAGLHTFAYTDRLIEKVNPRLVLPQVARVTRFVLFVYEQSTIDDFIIKSDFL